MSIYKRAYRAPFQGVLANMALRKSHSGGSDGFPVVDWLFLGAIRTDLKASAGLIGSSWEPFGLI